MILCVFVVFQEVNDVVQKVSGGEQPVPIWNDEGLKVYRDVANPMLYSLQFSFKVIIENTLP